MTAATQVAVRTNAPIATWFGVGGAADHSAEPASVDELRALIDRFDGRVRVLGDGANLLVDDEGVDGLVVSLGELGASEPDRPRSGQAGSLVNRGGVRLGDEPARGIGNASIEILRVSAGMALPKLIVETVRAGLGGLEGLAGVPATVGGAVRMNAGGAFGEIGSVVRAVRGVTLAGDRFEKTANDIAFGYRSSGLDSVIITEVDLALTPGDADALRTRLKDVMAAKKASQPLAERSAGCVFKNPTVAGERISAGRLIDEAGCKGIRIGSAAVSPVHANFITVERDGCARDVLALIDRVREVVADRHGVMLEQELIVWRRGDQA